MLKFTASALLATAAIAMCSATMASAQPNQPYDKPAATPLASPALHHGIMPRIRLNAVISDGQPAAFTAQIFNTTTTPVQFLSATIVWSFSGLDAHRRYAELSGLSTPVTTSIGYVDLDRLWIRVGTLFKSSSFQLAGKVTVPDRTQWGSTGQNAQFLCVQLIVQETLPGAPNAGWKEESPMSCSQYSVSQ